MFSIAIHNGEGAYLADVTVPTEELALAVLARLNGQELPDEVSSVLMKGDSAMPNLSAEERTMRARLAAHQSWANTADPTARTAAARDAFARRFEDQVDPDRTLPPAERRRRAEHARKAYFQRLALKSAQARRARARSRGGEQ